MLKMHGTYKIKSIDVREYKNLAKRLNVSRKFLKIIFRPEKARNSARPVGSGFGPVLVL